MRLLIVLLLGINFTYTLSYDAPVKENSQTVKPSTAVSHYSPEEKEAEDGIQTHTPDYSITECVAPSSAYLYIVSESWWKSRFSFLGDK